MMNCHYHPDRPVARECRVCHELICSDCVVPVGENAVCKSCVAESLVLDERGVLRNAAAAKPASVAVNGKDKNDNKSNEALKVLKTKHDSMHAGYKNGFLTVLFSCLPGLGHYYLGMQKRGLNLMILFFLIIFLNTIVPNALSFPLGIAIPILWFYSQFDALKYRTQINAGETVDDVPLFPQLAHYMKSASIGWVLAGFGAIAFIYSALDFVPYEYHMREAVKEGILALVLFFVGFWILKGKPLPKLQQPVQKEESEDHNHA